MAMGTLVFLIIHAAVALFLTPWGLVLTIPLHLIYGAVLRGHGEARPNRWTHIRCPDCREMVLKDAVVCRFCGCELVPEPPAKIFPWS